MSPVHPVSHVPWLWVSLSCSSCKAKGRRRGFQPASSSQNSGRSDPYLKITGGHLQLVPALSLACFGRRALSVSTGPEPMVFFPMAHSECFPWQQSKVWQILGFSTTGSTNMLITVRSVQLKNVACINQTYWVSAALLLAHFPKVYVERCILSRVHGASAAL